VTDGQFDPRRCEWRRQEIKGVQGEIRQINETLRGNGHEGLLSRMARIETINRVLLGLSSAILVAVIVTLIKVGTT